MKKTQLAVNQLRALTTQITIPTTPQAFYPILQKFAVSLLNNGLLVPILNIIKENESLAQAQLKPFEDAGLDELARHYKKLRSYVTDNNVHDPLLIQALDTFQAKFQHDVRLSRLLFVPLEQALYALVNDEQADHSNFVMLNFGKIKKINDDKYISMQDAFPAYDAWEHESACFAQYKVTADWHSLNQMIAFIERCHWRHSENLIADLTKKGVGTKHFEEERRDLLAHILAAKERPSSRWPTIETYKGYALTLMNSIEDIAGSLKLKHEITFDPSSGRFKINDAVTDFKQIGCPSNIILAALIPQEGPIKKKSLGYEAARTKIVTSKSYDDNESEPDIYEICRSITKHIAKIGYPDFLIATKSIIKINTDYL